LSPFAARLSEAQRNPSSSQSKFHAVKGCVAKDDPWSILDGNDMARVDARKMSHDVTSVV